MRRHLAIPLITLLAMVGLTACGGSDDHNDADIAFARGMIPHHEQAVEMANLVTDADTSADVRDLATEIKGAQQPEIETLQGWLDEWDADDHMDSMDHDGDEQDGMVSESSMEELKELSGEAFERRWLELMIKHHEGAIDASVLEVRDGRNGDAVHLAKEIVDTQQAEIDTMKGLAP